MKVSEDKKAELLLPAGSLERLKTAILYGADAVYAGTPDLSMRTKSNFTLEELIEGVEYVHEHGKKIYLTLNLFSHNKDISKLPQFLDTIKKVNPDGLIISDPGIFKFVKENAPGLKLQISTQANVCSWLTVKFWEEQGASLVVLGREVSFAELKEIRGECPNIGLEVFIHGAMCMTYSGRCLLSNFLAERGANQGNCAHSCRWNYKLKIKLKDESIEEINIPEEELEKFGFFLEEEFRTGEYLEIIEDERGSYILNSKDLCLLPKLNEYLSIGVNSLKIEGRNKTNYYAALTAHAYRHAIDDWYKDPEAWRWEDYMDDLYSLQNRGYTLAFHDGRLTDLAHNYDDTKSVSEYEFAGVVDRWEGDDLIFENKNTINGGDLIEFISPFMKEKIRLRLSEFEDAKTGKILEKLSPGQKRQIRINKAVFQSLKQEEIKDILPQFTVARKKKYLTEKERQRVVIDLEAYKAQLDNRELSPEKKALLVHKADEQINKMTNTKQIQPKSPRLGVDGCCGKGCNGCMIFWNDPKYKDAREKMKGMKIGEKL